MARVRVTIREKSSVEHSDHESVAAAIDGLETRLSRVDATREPTRVFSREIAPVAQVAARGELKAGRARGGIDLRGDGSAEAWTGRWRREVVAARPGESAYDALRRALDQRA